ncbi:MAG: type II CRISPR-associated endonuclease Cas1 [Planctomycetaceae bacterium]|jgi:CRISPR-associated protein Cas1|nr:type II CRISPR-associated endonuclease Cas1 [Planctomycetaceae bacterium]
MSEHRILDFSSSPYRLHIRYEQLVIEPENGSKQTVPLEEIAVVLVSHRKISFTQAVLEGIAEHGGILIACNHKSLPVGVYTPLAAHCEPAQRIQMQITTSEPLLKKAWKQIVQTKIRNQGTLLNKLHGSDYGLSGWSKRVRSGDPHNVEAYAAKRYWKHLFYERDSVNPAFRRDRTGDDFRNLALNYGYGVLRAAVARAVCAVGFHPAIGLHHHNKYNAYCLADDLMEPFRPAVDEAVYMLTPAACGGELTSEIKQQLLAPLLGRFRVNGELETLFDASTQLAESLVNFFDKRCKKLRLPDSCEVYEEPKPF